MSSFKDKNDINQEALIDLSSREVVTETNSHYMMHEGNHYFIKTWLINTGAISTFDEFMFITPNSDIRIHAKVSIQSDDDATFDIYEAPTTTANGSAVPSINCDRNSSNTAELLPFASPTVTVDGTLIWSARTGGSGVTPIGGSSGVSLSTNYEIIAKANTKYMFRLTKNTSNDTVMDIDFYWYEHAPLN